MGKAEESNGVVLKDRRTEKPQNTPKGKKTQQLTGIQLETKVGQLGTAAQVRQSSTSNNNKLRSERV